MTGYDGENADRKIVDDFSLLLKKHPTYDPLLKAVTPLVNAVRDSEPAKRFLKPHALTLIERFEKSGQRMKLLKEDSKAEGKDQIVTLRKAFLYLALFETAVTNLVDLMVLLLVATHQDFYVYNNRAYVKRPDDLDDASLGEKFAFLNHHGLHFFNENLNKNLRNKIAHMDFDINSDGTISVEQQRFDLTDETLKLSATVLIAGEVLSSCGIQALLAEIAPR